MKKMNGKKIAALMTALVLALGVSIPAGTALADEKTDSLRDAIYRTLKEKQKAQEEAPTEIVAPPVHIGTESGAAQTEEQTEAQPEEAAAEEAAPEVTSPYLRMKVTGAATLTDVTGAMATVFQDAEVLAAFRIENAEANATVTVALAQKPAMAEGDKLQLVGLNDWIINKRMVVGGLEIGQKVQFTVRMVDGFALILHRAEPAAEEAPEAAQPAEEVKPEAEVKSEVEEAKPEELTQPEAEPEITADAVTTPSKADVAKQILKGLASHSDESIVENTEVESSDELVSEDPAAAAAKAAPEQIETVEEDTEVQNNEEENTEETSEELNEELPEQPEAVVREEEELGEEPAEEEAEDEEISEESDDEEAGEDAPEFELEEKAAEETAGEAEEQIEAPIEETSNEVPVTPIEETMSEVHEETDDESMEAPADEPAEETEAPIEAAVEETDEAVIEETAEEIPSNPEDLRKLAHKFSDLVILDDYNTPLGIEDFKKITMLDVTDVRIDPDGMSPIFLTLEKDEEVTLIGMEGDWAQIVVDEEIGYIYKDALEAEPVEEEAVTEAAAEEEAVTEAAAEETAEEAVEPEKKVTIFTSRRVVMEEGETVNLTSKIEGFEGYEVMYQWECDQGNGFQPVEAANAATYAFTASAETLSWGWQLMVYYR